MARRNGTMQRIAFLAVLLAAGAAQAQDYDVEPDSGVCSNLEVTVGIGAMARGTTGVGAPLLAYGYDHGGGMIAGLGLRLFFAGSTRFIRHGVLLRGAFNAGSSFGLVGGYGFATTTVDAAYVIRFN